MKLATMETYFQAFIKLEKHLMLENRRKEKIYCTSCHRMRDPESFSKNRKTCIRCRTAANLRYYFKTK